MKQINDLIFKALLFSSLVVPAKDGTAAWIDIEWIDQQRGMKNVQLLAVTDTEVRVLQRMGTAVVERHIKHPRIHRLRFEAGPDCDIAHAHFIAGETNAAFVRWEAIWRSWQTAAERGWIDSKWKPAWWEVLQHSKARRSHLDTLLFAESFIPWFGFCRDHQSLLFKLIAECFIELDQYDSALPYLDAIAIDSFPHPPEQLHSLRFKVHSGNTEHTSALEAWLDDCIFSGHCEPQSLNSILEIWDSQPHWRDLDPPKPIQLNDRNNPTLNDPS
ncbi:MAG: hypothetical protein JJU20_12365 [Opitutales bacterium]|nr:hypothetical protein [Opitutales bacterium]